MSYNSDIAKALKEGGFKLISTNKHMVYQNGEGRIVRLHLGTHVRRSRATTVLKTIRRGDVVSGKVEKVRDHHMPVWQKETAKVYVLWRGGQEVGRLTQIATGQGWAWELTVPDGDSNGTFTKLDEAKAFLEGL